LYGFIKNFNTRYCANWYGTGYTIPAFHYFFYLKALQSIFFGFGFIFLITWLYDWIKARKKSFKIAFSDNLVIASVLLYALIYYPIYCNRVDFVELRQQALQKEKETDKIDIYNFIVKNVPLDNVMLCPHGLSLFPVMPTGIKMVSVETYFSNPYVSYDKREKDRVDMLAYLTTSTAASPSVAKLFYDYHVNDILLSSDDYAKYKNPSFANSAVIFTNGSYTILSFTLKPEQM
jgi:hypothetical protein